MAKQAKKRGKRDAAAVKTRHPVLLLLTVVPMTAGLVLFIAAWMGWVLAGTAEAQAVIGALLMLFGFAAANALQRVWRLAAGWALIGLAVWWVVTPPVPLTRYAGMAAGAAGLVLVLIEFIRRYRDRERR